MRPISLDYEGAFLAIGNGQLLHLLKLLQSNEQSSTRGTKYGGRDNHIAINVKSINLIQEQLNKYYIPFQLSSSGRTALFCRDPDGNALEFVEKTMI
jgi:glyoxylase I family protein